MLVAMLNRILQTVAGVAVAFALLALTWPQVFSAQRTVIVAQAVSFRGLSALVAVGGVVVLLVVSLFLPRLRRFIATLAVMLAVFALINVVTVAGRGLGSTPTGFGSTVRVLSWNTGGAVSAEEIADLALDYNASIIALPETSAATARKVAALMATAGNPMSELTREAHSGDPAMATSLLTSVLMGEYTLETGSGNTNAVPSVVATPANPAGPTIVAVHAIGPILGEMANWRADLSWLKNQCRRGNVILAGDFNATVDHMHSLGAATLGNCTSAGQLTGSAAVGTWPTALPPALGTPIDHIMFSADWRPTGMRVVSDLDAAGSDHRPVLVWLAPVEKAVAPPEE